MFGRGKFCNSKFSWLSTKIKQCGEIVRVSVCDCEGGWASVIQFTQQRERQNREDAGIEKAKRVEVRESDKLPCRITYVRNRNRQSKKKGPTLQGDVFGTS